VDVQPTTDTGGGYDVGWTKAGEWLAYTVNVTTADRYTLAVRVASNGAGGTFHVESEGIDKTGPVIIPNTGGWQTWRTVTVPVTLAAGPQLLRLAFDAAGSSGFCGNVNWLKLAPIT